MSTLHYRDVWKTLDNFDLVLFHGTGIVSKVVSKLSSAKLDDRARSISNPVDRPDYYTHCGLVIRPNLFPKDNPLSRYRELYIFESTMSGSEERESNKAKTPIGRDLVNRSGSHGPPPVGASKGFLGVQLRPLREVLEAYTLNPSTDIGIARLTANVRQQLYIRFDMIDLTTIPRQVSMFKNTLNSISSSSLMSDTSATTPYNNRPSTATTPYNNRVFTSNRPVTCNNRSSTSNALSTIPLLEPSKKLIDSWMTIFDKYNKTRYEVNIINLLSIGIKCLRCCKCTCNNRIVCSELVTFVLRDLDILSDNVDPENVLPTDFLKDPRTENCTFDVDGEIPCLYERPFILRCN